MVRFNQAKMKRPESGDLVGPIRKRAEVTESGLSEQSHGPRRCHIQSSDGLSAR